MLDKFLLLQVKEKKNKTADRFNSREIDFYLASSSSSSSSTTTNFKVGMCIDTPTLGRLALAPTIQQQSIRNTNQFLSFFFFAKTLFFFVFSFLRNLVSTNSSLQQIPTVNSSIANQNDTQVKLNFKNK